MRQSENWVARKAVVGGMAMSKRVSSSFAVIMVQLHSQRVFLLVIASKNKNKPGEKRRLHCCLHSSTTFTMATGPALAAIHSLTQTNGDNCTEGDTLELRFSRTSFEMFHEQQQLCCSEHKHTSLQCVRLEGKPSCSQLALALLEGNMK